MTSLDLAALIVAAVADVVAIGAAVYSHRQANLAKRHADRAEAMLRKAQEKARPGVEIHHTSPLIDTRAFNRAIADAVRKIGGGQR